VSHAIIGNQSNTDAYYTCTNIRHRGVKSLLLISHGVESLQYHAHFNMVNAATYVFVIQWLHKPRLKLLECPLANSTLRMGYLELQEELALQQKHALVTDIARTNWSNTYVFKNSTINAL
jgi:hypothetical protein